MMSRTLCFALVALSVLHGSVAAVAQDKAEPGMIPPSQIETKPTNCEFNVSVLAGADRVAGEGGLIIMIARLGDGERRRDLNRRRLYNARAYLTEFGHRAPPTIVAAEGARVNGFGRIELYVEGKLFHVLMINANDDLAVGACSFEGKDPCAFERERKLYPCLDRQNRRRD